MPHGGAAPAVNEFHIFLPVSRQTFIPARLIAKLKTRARELKAEISALYLAARHPLTPWYAKLFIVAIVAYALSPIDLIPDFIPVLGFLDEIVLLPIAIVLAVKVVPAGVLAECRARAVVNATISTRAGRIGAVVIVMLWIVLIIAAGLWAQSAFATVTLADFAGELESDLAREP